MRQIKDLKELKEYLGEENYYQHSISYWCMLPKQIYFDGKLLIFPFDISEVK